jgi:GntR family transcriptional regulator
MITRDVADNLLLDFISKLDLTVDEDASLPRYHQLSRVLARFIRAGGLHADDPFPSEDILATAFGVSRPTANKAVEELVTIGWLIRRPGQGSFVHRSPGRMLTYLSPRLTLSDLLHPESELVSTVIQRQVEPASEETAEHLQLEPKAPVLFIRRLFTFRDSPVLAIDSRLPEARFPGLSDDPCVAESLLTALQERYQCHIRYSEWGVEATELVERDLAKLLGVPPYTPVLLMTGVRYNEDGDAVEEYKGYVNQGVSVRAATHHDWTAELCSRLVASWSTKNGKATEQEDKRG